MNGSINSNNSEYIQGGGNSVGGSWGGPGPAGGRGEPPQQQQQQQQQQQWHNESPTIGRRMDDGGTSIWGKDVRGGAPGGNFTFVIYHRRDITVLNPFCPPI